MEHGDPLYSLIPFPDFKAILGIDDREDALSRYCLVTAAFTIEQYCKRRLLRRKHTDYLTFSGDPIFTLREYPVRKVLSVHAATSGTVLAGRHLFEGKNLVNPEHYYCIPDEGIHEDIPFSLVLRPPLRLPRGERAIRVRYTAGLDTFSFNRDFTESHAMLNLFPGTRLSVVYRAGYVPGKAPPDMASACLELAAWNMTRYRGRRIGMTGAVRGKGTDGEHLEPSMPENIRGLLEPYKRRVI
jgi:hypothetical protein